VDWRYLRAIKKNNLRSEIIYIPVNISAPSLMSGEISIRQMTGALMSPVRLQGGDPVDAGERARSCSTTPARPA